MFQLFASVKKKGVLHVDPLITLCHWLRTRRALMLLNDVLLRTRRALILLNDVLLRTRRALMLLNDVLLRTRRALKALFNNFSL